MTPITVIIPLYNGGAWIAQTLDAVFAQTRRAEEIVVVDDGSTDDGPDIIKRYPSVTLLGHSGKGPSEARVCGIQATQSPYIALLDQDDRWAPTHLERLGSILDEQPQCPAAIGRYTSFWNDAEPDFPEGPTGADPYDPWAIFPFHETASPTGVMFRRDALLESGGWPTHLEGVADVLTYFRISVNHPLIRSQAFTWARREHDKSHSAHLRAPERVRQYIARMAQAAKEAFALKIRHHPEQEGKYSEALRKFDTIHTVFEAIEGEKPSVFRQAAQSFENAYADEPGKLQWMACNGLAWMVSIAGTRQSDGRLAASFLLQHWPTSCSITGPLLLNRLEDMLGRSLAWDYYRGAPWSVRKLPFFALACCRRVKRKVLGK